MFKKLLLTIFLFILIISYASAQTTITLDFNALVDDTKVDAATPDTNFGADNEYHIQGGASGELSLLKWNITAAGLPMNIVITDVRLNLTSRGGVTINSRVFVSTNTTWDELNVTFNTFFCNVNSSNQIDLASPGSCTTLVNSSVSLSGTINTINPVDVTGSINPDTEFVTFVLDSKSQTGGQWRGRSNDDVTPSNRPTLEITFITAPSATNLTETDVLDLSSCMDSVKDMTQFEDEERLYIWGVNALTERIAVIDVTQPNNMILETCFNFGDLLTNPETINFLPSQSPGAEAFLLAAGQDVGIGGLLIINITNNGQTLTLDKQVDVASGFYEVQKLNSITTDDTILIGCDFANQRIYEIDRVDGSATIFNTLPGADCKGITDEIQGFGNAFHFVTQQNQGQTLLQNLVTTQFTDVRAITSSSRDRVERQGNIIAVGSDDLRFYTYSTATNNITARDLFQGTRNQIGNEFVGVTQYFTTNIRGNPPQDINIVLLDITDLDNVTQIFDIVTGFNSSANIVTLLYDFPTLFMMVNDNPDLLVSFNFFGSEFQPENNKKPVIQNLNPSGSVVASQGVQELITYDILNPETALINEKVLTNQTCEYKETELTLQDFEGNVTICSTTAIGTIKGVDFGTGLNLTSCLNDVITLPISSVSNNTLISFDIFTPTNQTGTANIDFIQFDGTLIEEIFITINDSVLTVVADNRVILKNITVNSTTGNVPTRIFFNINPTTTNPDLIQRMFYSTNFFTRNNDVSVTFCDDNEFCFLGDFSSGTTPFNNFFGIQIDSASGNLVLDNFRVVETNEYPVYEQITNLAVTTACNFTQTGDFKTRIYASDETFGHNYLSFQDIDFTVQITALVIPNATLVGTSGLAEIFTFIASSFAGGDEGTLILLALLFIAVMAIVAWKATEHWFPGVLMIALFTIFFFFVGWLPLIALVILIIVVALGFAFMFSTIFNSGGGGM